MKKSTIGIIISFIGLFVIGISIGKKINGGDTNIGLILGGLFIIFLGFFIVIFNNKKKNNES